MNFKNLAWFGVSNTPGTSGDFTVSTAVDSLHVTLGAADDGKSFRVRAFESGVGSEVRTGCVYTHSGTSLSRGTLEMSTSGSALNFTSAAQVQIITETAQTADEAYRAPFTPAKVVGGIAVGDEGAAGSFYEGYVLSWGDEFADGLDILAPAAPRGRWWTTRSYGPPARGSDTLLGTMYDFDPAMTGHNDSNRGVPVGYDNLSQLHSIVNLQARAATAGEQADMSSTRNEVAAMLAGPGAVHYYPSTQDEGDVIVEARIRYTAAAGNPSGWHPTFWSLSLNPAATQASTNSDEIDWEGNSNASYLKRNTWTAGSQASFSAGTGYAHDGAFHVVSMLLNKSAVELYVDESLHASGAWDANSKNKPQYPLLTSHVYNGEFESDSYNAGEWDADTDGATMSVDWIRVWRRRGKQHFAPRVDIQDYFVDFNTSATIQLPSAAAIWGDATVTEYLQVIIHEENEPGVTHSTAHTQFPSGVSYNTSTRQITVNLTTGNTGRLNFALSAWKADGSTGEPLRFAVNVGPVINLSGLSYDSGDSVSLDVYAACDCGVLTSDGTAKAKTISVSGLGASGLSYDDATGLLTGTAVTGSYTLTVECTNSVGQTASKSVAMTISGASSYAYESWTGPGWFDASDGATVTTSGSNVTTWGNQRAGGAALSAAGAAITYPSGVQNGLAALRFARDAGGAPARLSPVGGASAALSTMCQGNDKPYTVIAVYKPTDTNTGFIWSWSDTVDGTDEQVQALVRRSGSACSSRRRLTTAGGTDVNFGSGQAANSVHIVAIKYTGTAVSIWDNSTTAAVSGTSHDFGAFNTQLIFYIGTAESAGTDPTYPATACAMDFFEVVIEDSAKADADIQQAITDLATKWGITLS